MGLSERTAERCKRKNMAGTTVVLKLKTTSFTTLTRNRAISDPTQLADTIFAVGKALLTRLLDDKPGRNSGSLASAYRDWSTVPMPTRPTSPTPTKRAARRLNRRWMTYGENSGAVPLKKGGACKEFSPNSDEKALEAGDADATLSSGSS